MNALWERNAIEAAHRIRAGSLTSRELVSACVARIEESDASLRAWRYFDGERALADADARDELRRHGGTLGPLHGIPIGLKDIFDTDNMPTEYGSPIHAGRLPRENAAVVDKLLEVGAVIMGKTASTEFAYLHPTDTVNPHNSAHSPGGSSSGSAAAVAAGHVPLAEATMRPSRR